MRTLINYSVQYSQVTKDLKDVYICDIGISRLKAISTPTKTTASNSPIGTYPYMAPEISVKDIVEHMLT